MRGLWPQDGHISAPPLASERKSGYQYSWLTKPAGTVILLVLLWTSVLAMPGGCSDEMSSYFASVTDNCRGSFQRINHSCARDKQPVGIACSIMGAKFARVINTLYDVQLNGVPIVYVWNRSCTLPYVRDILNTGSQRKSGSARRNGWEGGTGSGSDTRWIVEKWRAGSLLRDNLPHILVRKYVGRGSRADVLGKVIHVPEVITTLGTGKCLEKLRGTVLDYNGPMLLLMVKFSNDAENYVRSGINQATGSSEKREKFIHDAQLLPFSVPPYFLCAGGLVGTFGCSFLFFIVACFPHSDEIALRFLCKCVLILVGLLGAIGCFMLGLWAILTSPINI